MTILFDGRFALYPTLVPYGQQANGVNHVMDEGPASGIADRIELVTDPLGSDTVCRLSLYADDAEIGSGHRSEIRTPLTNDLDTQAWYWWAIMLSPGWTADAYEFAWSQFHQTPDPEDEQASPPMVLFASTDERVQSRNAYDTEAVSTPGTVQRRDLFGFRMQFGVWHEFVVRAKWSGQENGGEFSIWQNRRLRYRETGQANAMNNLAARSIYQKNGIYNYGGVSPAPSLMRAYTKGIVICDGTAQSFDAFMAEIGRPEITELERVSGPVCGSF